MFRFPAILIFLLLSVASFAFGQEVGAQLAAKPGPTPIWCANPPSPTPGGGNIEPSLDVGILPFICPPVGADPPGATKGGGSLIPTNDLNFALPPLPSTGSGDATPLFQRMFGGTSLQQQFKGQ